ncbi:tetratricopeptide repeat protein [Limnoraphis robusta Tam1]|uniref:Tetratricopeptide repeat protein n=1 Tax=Limnoraphis robusta CCNP1315 TaxID=3110306 RepID=A0ABU5U511_9CYAN|nr:tetratricopeptide repeat protein [Limnoraphis robusta]MEA5501028.1 tetratricopeptide repeat protein [Limnoraphis robusta BA-68 BA1]MEA5522006.1 tetratricopeptide repeat protein [Limnoraphis robusta CCNP1315]MEA5540538.1 tetratricopeptide repeat protein [Limnoraphis robusta Tam1]MEA5545249.1 tetratricopeptide repeat protein [Limnoraphis robusta CCNP1324]
MEIASFLTWFILVAVVAGVGITVMTYAYWGAGSVSILFEQAIPLPLSVPDSEAGTEASVQFQQGYNAYQQKNYRQAIDYFTRAIQQVSTLAEAYHNRGLAYANLRQDDNSVVNLLSASELYGQQEKAEQITLLKQHLEALRARKLAQSSKS